MNTNFNNDPNLDNTSNQTDEPIANENQANQQTQYQTPYHSSNENQSQYNPFEKNTQSYTTYQQWQAQQNASHIKKTRKISKKPFIAVGCVAAAAAIFLAVVQIRIYLH